MMSSYFPAAGNNWSDWFPLGDNKFPKEAQVSAVSTGVNATSLYVVGLDQAVWSKFFPANDGKWSDWFSLDKLPSPILQVDATKVERHQTGAYITVRGKEFTPGALVDITVEGLVNVPKGQYAGTGQVRLDGTFQAIVDARLHSGQTGAATLRVTDSVSGDSVTTSTTAYSSPR